MAKAPKKAKKARRSDGGPVDPGLIDIPEPEVVASDEDQTVTVDPETGGVTIENSDGSITVDPTGSSLWQAPETGDATFDENLALKIDPMELGRIANDLLEAIATDKQDRSQWEQMRAKCIELLGIKLEDPKGDVSRSAMGMSTSVARDPTLLTAVNFFRANAYGELCPSAGPVKVVNFTTNQTETSNELAEALQTDLNYYLTTTASEYYPDMYYMLWWTGLTSGTFKKVYYCPLRQRPVSEYVDGTKLIVPSTATDLKNAARVTHEAKMSKADMRAMQLAGVYRDIHLVEPLAPMIGAVDAKRASIEGKAATPQRPEDEEYTVFECYCKLDIKGFEHQQSGKSEPSGLPLPYRVTIDDTSREILEIRRNWDEEDDEELYRVPKMPFVLFPFSTGVSRIYGSGLGHEMGNLASALTALMRICIDAGILGNYPGFIKAKGPGRDLTNEIMVPPGGAAEIDTGGMPIQQFIMNLPYKDVSPNTVGFIEQLRGAAKELGGTANIPVAEGRQDAPVGTTLAMIEQATKPLSATHKMLHAAQSEEFRLLVDLFKDYPEALWRGNRRPAMGTNKEERLAKFKAALDNCDIQPMADPNVPSEMHRKLIAMGLKQLTAPGGIPNPAYNQIEVDRYCSRVMFKMTKADFDKLLAPPQQGQPDPAQMLAQIEAAKIQVQREKVALEAQKAQWQAENAKADRESKEHIEAARIAASMNQQDTGPAPQPPADPFQAAELALKERAQRLKEMEALIKAQDKQADRDSKEAVEAFKLVTATAVHPEAAGEIDRQMTVVAPFLEPAAKAKGAADGGAVEADEAEEYLRPAMSALETALRIRRIQDALNQPPPESDISDMFVH